MTFTLMIIATVFNCDFHYNFYIHDDEKAKKTGQWHILLNMCNVQFKLYNVTDL